MAIGLYLYYSGLMVLLVQVDALGNVPKLTWLDGMVFGVRFGLTYMGFIVLFRVGWEFVREVFLIRGRRLYSIARLAIYESNRKMWAPWVVITVFLLVLAFTHWFLQPPRAAEMGRLYVGTLSLLCSILLTVMVTIMTPLSLPTDIQQQTIYTVVSKPVRRSELIWGRMIGYMALVTVLVLVFGGISLAYLWRTVGTTLTSLEQAAFKAKNENRIAEHKLLLEQADQLRVRDAGEGSDQGLALVPRLSRHAARGGHRRGCGTADEGAEEPHRRGDAVGGDLEIRQAGAGPVLAAGPAQLSESPDPGFRLHFSGHD